MASTSTVTFLVCDLVGSTARHARIGEDAADDFRAAFFGALRAAVARHEGEEVKNLGDGLIAVFRRSTVNALRCAADLHASMEPLDEAHPVELRIGISVGEAAEEDGDWFGLPVVEAARLCSLATSRTTLASGLVRSLVGSRGNHRFDLIGRQTLKGLPEPVEVWAVDSAERATVGAPGPGPAPPDADSTPTTRSARRLAWVLTAVLAAAALIAVAVVVANRDDSTSSSPSTTASDGTASTESSTTGTDSSTTVASTVAPAAATIPTPIGYEPVLTQRDCAGDVIERMPAYVECFTLTVPENRATLQRTIDLGVYRVPAVTNAATAPTVISIGPYDQFEFAVREVANVVVLPARGYTLTEPALTCPEVDTARIAALARPSRDPVSVDEELAAFRVCRDRLTASGADLSAYNAEGEVGDITDYMIAAELDEAVLTAHPADAPAALVTANRFPGSIRGVYLENPVDPGSRWLQDPARDLAAAYGRLATLCRADTVCNESFPDMLADLAAAEQQVDTNPVKLPNAGLRSTGRLYPLPAFETHEVLVDGPRIAEAIFIAFDAQRQYGLLPSYIRAASAEVTKLAASAAITFELSGHTAGGAAYLSHGCAVVTDLTSNAAASADALPLFAGVYDASFDERCAIWDVPPLAVEFTSAAEGAVPTFIVVGELTPYPAIEWADNISNARPNTTIMRMPTLGGHIGFWDPDCYVDLLQEFVLDPSSSLDVEACEAESEPIQFIAGPN